jgi:hypothetical protein
MLLSYDDYLAVQQILHQRLQNSVDGHSERLRKWRRREQYRKLERTDGLRKVDTQQAPVAG